MAVVEVVVVFVVRVLVAVDIVVRDRVCIHTEKFPLVFLCSFVSSLEISRFLAEFVASFDRKN